MSPAERIGDAVRKIVALELARQAWLQARDRCSVVLGRRLPLYERVIGFAEKPLIEQVLTLHKGNQSHAALALGINRNTLRKKLRAHGIGTA